MEADNLCDVAVLSVSDHLFLKTASNSSDTAKEMKLLIPTVF